MPKTSSVSKHSAIWRVECFGTKLNFERATLDFVKKTGTSQKIEVAAADATQIMPKVVDRIASKRHARRRLVVPERRRLGTGQHELLRDEDGRSGGSWRFTWQG